MTNIIEVTVNSTDTDDQSASQVPTTAPITIDTTVNAAPTPTQTILQQIASWITSFKSKARPFSKVGSTQATNNDAVLSTDDVFHLGNVGIGTSNPSERLEVIPSSVVPLNLATHLPTSAAIYSSVLSNNTYKSILQLVSVRQSLVLGSLSNGFLGFSTIDNSNIEGVQDAARIAVVNENGGHRNSSTSLSFWTNSGGTATTAALEKMRILSNGNVGIGTTTPTEALHVIGNIAYSGSLINVSSKLAKKLEKKQISDSRLIELSDWYFRNAHQYRYNGEFNTMAGLFGFTPFAEDLAKIQEFSEFVKLSEPNGAKLVEQQVGVEKVKNEDWKEGDRERDKFFEKPIFKMVETPNYVQLPVVAWGPVMQIVQAGMFLKNKKQDAKIAAQDLLLKNFSERLAKLDGQSYVPKPPQTK